MTLVSSGIAVTCKFEIKRRRENDLLEDSNVRNGGC